MGEAVGCLHWEEGGVRAASAWASPISIWVFGLGKNFSLTPFSLLPEKGETVKQMTSLNRWSQWSMLKRKLRGCKEGSVVKVLFLTRMKKKNMAYNSFSPHTMSPSICRSRHLSNFPICSGLGKFSISIHKTLSLQCLHQQFKLTASITQTCQN